MIENNNNQKIKKIVIIGLAVVIAVAGAFLVKNLLTKDDNSSEETPSPTPGTTNPEATFVPTTDNSFNTSIIKVFNSVNDKKNYLLSPYNIEIALNMLREGADGKTKEELDKVLGNRTINDISVKDVIGIANAIFVKEKYKDDVKKDFYSILDTKYHAEVIYDKFTSPTKINNWVKVKTNGMIKKILDKMNENFVMGLASALAIDVKWAGSFACESTNSEEFTKVDNTKMNAEMMHKSYKSVAKYFKTSDAEGIIIPYQKEENSNVELEFVGILPNTNLSTYISNLTSDKINNYFNNLKEASDKIVINLSLPRFTYDYETEDFISMLKELGIKEAFDQDNANFTKMIEIKDNVYVGEAIHKTHIEVSESGTKAAAVTYFGMYSKTSSVEPRPDEIIDIKFNKPFAYMIREKNSGEVLFFGTVYEPNVWKESTCSK